MGKPAELKPAGIDSAGKPVTVIMQQTAIQSM
jgi:hypothetical protein